MITDKHRLQREWRQTGDPHVLEQLARWYIRHDGWPDDLGAVIAALNGEPLTHWGGVTFDFTRTSADGYHMGGFEGYLWVNGVPICSGYYKRHYAGTAGYGVGRVGTHNDDLTPGSFFEDWTEAVDLAISRSGRA